MESVKHRLKELLLDFEVLHLVGPGSLKGCIYGKDDAVGWREAKAIFYERRGDLRSEVSGAAKRHRTYSGVV
jgi:hypothetical protein